MWKSISSFVLAAAIAIPFASSAERVGAAGMNPVPAPASGAYLGAFINPQKQHGPPSQFVSLINDFESQMASVTGQHRVLALHLHFYTWNSITNIGSDPSIADDFAKGRTPVLTWTCGDSLRNITAGSDDNTTLAQAARAIAALHKPVMMRWFHEFNFNLNHSRTNGQAENCFDTDDEGSQSQEFIAAWRHVHDVFVKNGATNISWVWCPGAAPLQVQRHNLMAFFPGSEYVDWIGGDFYDRRGAGFVRTATPFYNMAHGAQPNMPLVVVETGEQASGPVSQAQYFSEMQSQMPSTFPAMKAVIYFNAPGNAPNNWVLTSDGMNAFAHLAASPYFSARP